MVDQDQAITLWDALDLNKDGVLTRGEVITALRIGSNGSGEITIPGLSSADMTGIADWFDQSDVSRDSRLTRSEFIAGLETLNANS
ncbi:EF-hand domain-containing protein [Nocardia sp. NPDC004711]